VLLLLFSGSCRITVTGSNLDVAHTSKLLMSNGIDNLTLNVTFTEFLCLNMLLLIDDILHCIIMYVSYYK